MPQNRPRKLSGQACPISSATHHFMPRTFTLLSSRLKSMLDAKGQTTFYNYFVDDNLKQVSYSNAVVATPAVSFTYDTNYNRRLTMVDGTGTNTYAYNLITTNATLGAGRLASIDGPR